MDYNYKDNTLLHGVGFNLQRFESVVNNGIVSKNRAQNLGITYTRNYIISGQQDDYISMLRVGNIDPSLDISAYKIHTSFGINFIIENVAFLDNKNEVFIHREDEVMVKDVISTDYIKGIAIPLMYQNVYLYDLVILPPDLTNYKSITDIAMNYFEFLKKYGSDIGKDDLLLYLREIYYIHKALYQIKDDDSSILDREELIDNHSDVLNDLNEFLAEKTFTCFSSILGKNATLNDVVEYLSKNKYQIYSIPFESRNDGMKRG